MRQLRLVHLFLLGAAAAIIGAGQDYQALLSRPSVGLVFDSESGGLRLIEGNPGAASLSEPIVLTERLALATIIPDGRHALAVEEGSGSVVLISAGGRRELPGVLPGPVAVRVSRRGESAALFYADGDIQILTHLFGTMPPIWQAHLDRPLAAGIVADVSDDGTTLLAADGGMLRTWRRSGERSEVELGARISFATFLAESGDILAVADQGVVWTIRGGEPSILARSQDPIVSAAVFKDRIALASSGGSIAITSRGGEALGELVCLCKPDGLEAVNGQAVFRLTGPESGTVWMLDLGGHLPRLLFAAKAQLGSRDEVLR